MRCVRGHAPSLGTVRIPVAHRHRSAPVPAVRARHVIPRAARAAAAETETSVGTQHVVCLSFDAVVECTAEVAIVAFEAARRFWPGKIPGDVSDYADVFAMAAPCLEESSSFEAALMVRVLAEENLCARTRFRLELKERKAQRLKLEAAESVKMRDAVTTKQRAKLRVAKHERERELTARREEYVKENERLRAGKRTRPLNLREVVAGWDEIKLHAAIKFGVELTTNVGWEGRVTQPTGLQSVVNEVREQFSTGGIVLSADDTMADGEDDLEDDDLVRGDDERRDETNENVPSSSSPKQQWLRSHSLHHGALEFMETCAARGHTVVVMGGPGRSAKQCRAVLTHLGVTVAAESEDGAVGFSGGFQGTEEGFRVNNSKTVKVVGTEYGSARGLAVAAMMLAHEQPWQRWHLVDASLAELTRIEASGLPETSAFTSQFASWTPVRIAFPKYQDCLTIQY